MADKINALLGKLVIKGRLIASRIKVLDSHQKSVISEIKETLVPLH